MENENEKHIEPGTPIADSKYKILIDHEGPFYVYGNPPLKQEFTVLNDKKLPCDYTEGASFTTEESPTALCRCGASKNKPYCDGAHITAQWDSRLTADKQPLLRDAVIYSGVDFTLADNKKYCARAEFCMAHGSVWDLIEKDDAAHQDTAVQEVSNCPSGRLKLKDKLSGDFIEPDFKPAIAIIEDTKNKCSGPLWVRGGIPIEDCDSQHYETRNRVTLCRCGASKNKPYCDGTHVDIHFDDELSDECPTDEF